MPKNPPETKKCPKPEIILPDSPQAARYMTGIEGWVSRRGMFYGDTAESEQIARWDGATHVRCKDCDTPTEKTYLACPDCREKKAIGKWRNMPAKDWGGSDDDPPVYSEWFNAFFHSVDEIEFECEEHGVTLDEARLVICEPQYPLPVDPEDHLRDLMPDDDDHAEIPADIWEAFSRLNEFLINYKTPLSWVPGKYRVKMEGEKS